MGKIFLLLFGLLAGRLGHAHQGVCSDLMMGGQVAKILEQVQKLNPNLASAPTSMEELYLRLKREDEATRGRALPEDLARHLREIYASQFQIEDISQFYSNFLYNLETRVADVWRVQEARAQSGSLLKPELESFATHLLDTFFSPNALNDKALTADDAARFFATKPWILFPWSEAIVAVQRFLEQNPGGTFVDFRKWYSGSLDWNQANRVTLALSRTVRPGMCCKSEPGCTACPHNRRSRK